MTHGLGHPLRRARQRSRRRCRRPSRPRPARLRRRYPPRDPRAAAVPATVETRRIRLRRSRRGLSREGGQLRPPARRQPRHDRCGLHDPPAGLAAWIGEKIVAWSSVAADGQPSLPRALLLAALTLWWATGTIASSMLPHWNCRHTEGAVLQPGDPSPAPAAVSIFGGERVPFPQPPRELAGRFVKVSVWQEHDRGGRFPGAPVPDAAMGARMPSPFRSPKLANPVRQARAR
jgi:hypothetical protein